jgi:ABC-type multidrug transport system ATPase subunit
LALLFRLSFPEEICVFFGLCLHLPPGISAASLLYSQSTPATMNAIASSAPHNPSVTSTPAVALDRVSRLFGNFVALREVSLALPAGSSTVLLGENGAGKSTLLKLVAGLTSPSFGHVTVFGERPNAQRGRIAYMSHATMLYDELTGLENLTYFAGLHADTGLKLAQTAADALRDVDLDPANPRRVGEYSQGMRQRAALARVLQSQPDLLLLDEPFSNLDAASAQSMIARLLAWLAEPTTARTLLLTTHQAELARPLARTTITLCEGRVVSIVEAES